MEQETQLDTDPKWDTGLGSSPVLMSMTLASLHQDTTPKIVLWQFDDERPMNVRNW